MKKILLLLVLFFLVLGVTYAQVNKEVKGTITEKDEVGKVTENNIVAKVSGTNSSQAVNVATYDFTTGSDKYYGTTNACVDLSGVGTGPWAMIAGDADKNGGIGSSDLISTRADLGTTNYNNNDVDMNGGVGSSDLIVVRKNLGKTSQLP